MNLQEKCTQLLEELFDGIDAGDFSDARTIPQKYKYSHLWALLNFADVLDDGIRLYGQLYTLAMEHGKAMLREKLWRGQKVRVAFLAVSAAEWPAEEVYRLLERDDRCESYIVVSPLLERDKEDAKQTYMQTCRFFEESGHAVRKVYDVDRERYAGWEELGGVPDILIHLNSWYRALPEEYWIESLPLSCLNCYIPYGIYVANSVDGNYVRDFVYNSQFANMLWRIYADSDENVKGYQTYGLLQGKNVFRSGYAKMDYFLHERVYGEEQIRAIWKIPAGADAKEMKKLILAPHHSFKGHAGIAFSTFHKNLYFWLYLAKKYEDKITFILKPHPNLRARAVEAGVFESFAACDAYLEEWNSLPNGKVVTEADYRDIFATSDGMIMDSASFLAEYMYVDKPLLFLRREGQAFNELGKKCLQCCYTERGEDYTEIENFLIRTILGGEDEKKEIRRAMFAEELDYLTKNQIMASESIYQDIVNCFSREA